MCKKYDFIYALICIFGLFVFYSSSANSYGVEYSAASEGGNRWRYDYVIDLPRVPANADAFTIYFDWSKYASLVLAENPIGWDSILIQPDYGIPADGVLDAISLQNIAGSQSPFRSDFSVSFEYLDAGSPQAQLYEFYQSNPFLIVASGLTEASNGVKIIPEPGSGWLAIFGFFLYLLQVKFIQKLRFLSREQLVVFRSIIFKRAIKPLAIVSFVFISPAANSTPWVEGIDLVSSIRVDRTNFDYTYSLRVRGDYNSYLNAAFSVSSTAPSSVILTPVVKLGSIDPGVFLRSSSYFTVRQNRLVDFDQSKIIFTFSGDSVSVPRTPFGARVGPVVFLEDGGRPIHEGSFPLRAENPTAGASLILKASIYGDVTSASYAFRDINGRLIASGSFNKSPNEMPWYYAAVTIPSEPFRISVDANGADGQISNFKTAKLFNPSSYSLSFEPKSAVLKKGEASTAKIVLKSNSAAGDYLVSLMLPSGYTGNSGPWSVYLQPGHTTFISTNFTAPVNGRALSLSTVTVRAAPKANPLEIQSSNVQLMVN